MTYEWDDAGNRSNFAKHGVDFADEESVLAGPCVAFVDNRFDYGEERYISLGLLARRVVVTAHSLRGGVTRIISMRKAIRRAQEIHQRATAAWPPPKQQLTIRLDADVLDWLKGNGRGYQTRINHILRAAMESPPTGRAPHRRVEAHVMLLAPRVKASASSEPHPVGSVVVGRFRPPLLSDR